MATTAVSTSSEKNVQIIHPTRTKAKSDPPLDFSFLNITSPKGKLHGSVDNCLSVMFSGGSRKKYLGGLAPHHLGGNNG